VAYSKYTDAARRRGLPEISKMGSPQLLYWYLYRRVAGTEITLSNNNSEQRRAESKLEQ
jgi:hypothetical protein